MLLDGLWIPKAFMGLTAFLWMAFLASSENQALASH